MWNRCVLIGAICAACGARPGSSAEPIAVPFTGATATTIAPATVRDDIVAPWTLTASDGSGLRLARVDAKAVLEGPLAFTELHLYFHNDENRIREGTFQITLPTRAAVSRFAMDNGGHWMEAEVVPKLVARRAYDDFLHRRQDPALLEKAAGNQFTAKVFPIAAQADTHVVVSWSHELPGTRYTLPLRGLPKIAQVDVELAFTGVDGVHRSERLAKRDWTPDHDFVTASATTAAAVGAGGIVAAQIRIEAGGGREDVRGVTLLVDTSASRALGYERYIAKVKALVGELRRAYGDALLVNVVAFDQDSEPIFDGRAAEFGDAHVNKLLDRGAAGASDLGQALTFLATHAVKPRVLVVGDGLITAGVEGSELKARVAALAKQVERLDVALAGGLRDDRAASQLVRAGLPHAGAVLDLDRDAVAVALAETVATDVTLEVLGASWVTPRTIASARHGAVVMVYAKLPRATGSIDVVAGGSRRTLQLLPSTVPLVERAVAGAELAELEGKLASTTGTEAATLRATIAQKSVAARVLSSETSMLVLETDDDYKRYRIDRKALVDILVVGPRGVERTHRSDIAPLPLRPDAPKAVPATAKATDKDRTLEANASAVQDTPTTDGPDNDHDGIPDGVDGCPSDPETYNGTQDDDGCPDRGRVIVSSTSIHVLEYIYFEADSAAIRRVSYPILDAVAATLAGNPDIELVEVQGHTDERGDDARNLDVSERRANAVVDYLVRKGVARSRLDPKGYGETQPMDPGHNEPAWAKNRRVGFLILRRAGMEKRAAAPAAPDRPAAPAAPPPPPPPPEPVTGELAAIEKAIAARDLDGALAKARAWHAREPGDVLALIGLAEALHARKADRMAARIYGSIIDLFPGRADMRRFAGERLAQLSDTSELVIDTYRRAVADRPDHLTGHRLLAYALVRMKRPADAFAAILTGLDQKYPGGRFHGGMRVLGDDAGMIGAVYAAAVPTKRADIAKALADRKLELATKPSTRFLLYWETDANDVDFHIQDARGGHAYYSQPKLASGGELYGDVTTGYGPECFAIPGTPSAGPYKLSLEYYAQGPMGYGMGVVEIQTFDPARGLTFDDRPYVIMTNHAVVDLGTYR